MLAVVVRVAVIVAMVIGCELVARKNYWGFVSWTVANILLICQCIWLVNPPEWNLVITYVLGQCYTTRALVRWVKDAKYEEKTISNQRTIRFQDTRNE